MELGVKIVKEAMRVAQLQEDAKIDAINYKSQISVEKQSLSLLKKEGELLAEQSSNCRALKQSLGEQEDFLKGTRDAFTRARLWRSYFQKFVTAMEPNEEHMSILFQEYQKRYSTLIEKYELNPEYLQIIEAEKTKRELTQVISDKRNELMKLETQREF